MVIKIKYSFVAVILVFVLVASVFFAHPFTYAMAKLPPNNENVAYFPIVMYHEVKNTGLGKDAISPTEFENDLIYLKENGFNTIVMSDLIAFVEDGIALPPNPIVISFDDAYLNMYTYAFPLLKKYNFKAVQSIIGYDIDEFTKHPSKNLNTGKCNWSQIKEMSDSGLIELQNHTYNLHKRSPRIGVKQLKNETKEEYKEALQNDLSKLDSIIAQHTEQTPTTIALPYGSYTKLTAAALREIGYKAILTCNYGYNTITRDPETLLSLRRGCRSHGNSIGKLLSKMSHDVKIKLNTSKEITSEINI